MNKYILGSIVLLAVIGAFLLFINSSWRLVGNDSVSSVAAVGAINDTYVIGIVAPLTGPAANLGVPYVQGMQMAADEVNERGGINRKKLEVAAQDGKLDGSESVSAVQQILFSNKPDIITTLFHLPAQAISPILEREKIPLVYEAYTRSMLTNPYAFKANFDSKDGCAQLVSYAKQHGLYKKLGVLTAKVEYGDLCIEGIKTVEPEFEEYRYVYGETDFRVLFAKANSDRVDTLMVINIDPEPVLMFKQLGELGYSIQVLCATASECIYPAVEEVASSKVLEGTLAVDFIPPSITDTPFAKKYVQLHPEASFTDYAWGAMGYENVMYIQKAMENCDPGDHACLTTALKAVKDYPSLIGSSGFKNNILQLESVVYQYRQGTWEEIQ